MPTITQSDILRTVTRNAFDAGIDYQLDGRVQEVWAAPDGALIKARVFGTKRTPYEQIIRLMPATDGRVTISGTCTCPVGGNCKHVAAVLFAYRDEAEVPPAVTRPLVEHAVGRAGERAGGQAMGRASKAVEAALPYDIVEWLGTLPDADRTETEEYPPTIRKRLFYVLGLGLEQEAGALGVALTVAELQRDGSTGAVRLYAPHQIVRGTKQSKFLRPSDRAIVRMLNRYDQDDDDQVAMLRAMLATGRARWGGLDGPVAREGEPVQGALGWAAEADGRQRPQLELPPSLVRLSLEHPWYVDPRNGVLGPVETGLPPGLLRALLAAPWFAPAHARRVREEIVRQLPGRQLALPRDIAPPEHLDVPLVPHLALRHDALAFDPATRFGAGDQARRISGPKSWAGVARLSWQYGPVRLEPGVGGERAVHDGRLYHVVRDAAAETRAASRLRRLGFCRLAEYDGLGAAPAHGGDHVLTRADQSDWIGVVLDELPKLRRAGWLVDIADDFPWSVVQPEGDVTVEVREGSGIDWFDLDLGVMVEGRRVNLVPALIELIGRGLSPAEAAGQPPLLLTLADGRRLAVPFRLVQPILAPLLELFAGLDLGADGDSVRLSRQHAGDLATLETACPGIVWRGGEALRALGRQLREHGGIPACAPPADFRATLRGYQAHGLAWLQFLRGAELGGVLADDMGLGKTVQALAHLATEQAAGRLDRPALVICPTSLVPNWGAEAARFAPSLRTLVLHGPHRAGLFADIGVHDLVITTYPLLARDHAVLAATEWHVVVLDEAQIIKNPLAAVSKLTRTLRARQRLCLSGTPLENHLGELWSLFDFLMPGFLGDQKGFGRRFRTPIEKDGDVERRTVLARRIAPFLLRRTKQEVAADLPAKTDIRETVELGDGQRAIYEGIRLAMHARVQAAIAARGLARSGIIILDALLKLRQACCDPRLLKLASAKAARAGSAKLERLVEMLPQMLEEGRRILLFSQFTSMLALIEAELDRLGLPYVLLTGDTRDRATPIAQFQSGKARLFLISLKAGGVGLNLTAADTVIHYDPWWNPAVENQATDRAHRIGQDKPVFVHRLVVAGSIEEKMEVLKQRKQALVDGILGASGDAALALNEGDLEMLFEASPK